jgi:hypothetical protein
LRGSEPESATLEFEAIGLVEALLLYRRKGGREEHNSATL